MRDYTHHQSAEKKYLYLRNERQDREKEEEKNKEYFYRSGKWNK